MFVVFICKMLRLGFFGFVFFVLLLVEFFTLLFLTFKGISSRVTFNHVMLFGRVGCFILHVLEVRLVACFGCLVVLCFGVLVACFIWSIFVTQTTFRVLCHEFLSYFLHLKPN